MDERFTEEFIAYSGRIERFLRVRGASAQIAEEITQQAWATAWAAREQWRGGSFRSWLITIAWNLYLGTFRRTEMMRLDACPDAAYSESFDRQIEAEQILARCNHRAAHDLRRHFYEDRYDGTSYERVRVFRSLANARKAMKQHDCPSI